jgi:elongation factor G
MVAEGNDALMEEFFDKGTLPEIEQIVAGLKQAVREMRIFPVLCASGLHNIGSDLILNFIVENLPAPTEREGIAANGGGRNPRRKSPSGPASLFVFKTTADPFAGRITYFKVITGVVKNDANLTERHPQHQSGWPTSAARRGKPCSRSPNSTPAISARWPN